MRYLLAALAALVGIQLYAEDATKLLVAGYKYPIEVVFNEDTKNEYIPENHGFNGETVWLRLSQNADSLILHSEMESAVFDSERQILVSGTDTVECVYSIDKIDILGSYGNDDYAEVIYGKSSNGKNIGILVSEIGSDQDGNILYGFRIYDGQFDSLRWGFTIYGVSNLNCREKETINGLTVFWKTNITPEQKRVMRRLLENMVHIKGGSFMMGSNKSNAETNEKPVHKVWLSDYYIDKYPITEEEFEIISGIKLDKHYGKDYPISGFSRNDCWELCSQMEELTGLKFTIPSEAQWEYAARGGENFDFSGSDNLNEVGWFKENSFGKIHPVGKKKPNKYGLYDMSGNVDEWCSDWYFEKYSSDELKDPLFRVRVQDYPDCILRGGSCNDSSGNCRVTKRNLGSPFEGGETTSFRPVIFNIDDFNMIK